MPCSEDEFHIQVLNPSVPISSLWRARGGDLPSTAKWDRTNSSRDQSRDVWRGLAGRTPLLLGSFIPTEMEVPMSQAEVSLQDPAQGLAGVGMPSLQPTSCVEMADGLVEEFGC